MSWRKAGWIWLVFFAVIAGALSWGDLDAAHRRDHVPPYWQQFVDAAIGSALLLGLWLCVRWMFASWRNCRRTLLGLAIFATLIAIAYTEENWRGKHDWENYKHELEAKGAVLDWEKYIPPPVPDGQNFFTVNTNFYLRFVKLQTAEQGEAARSLPWLNLGWGGYNFPQSDFSKSNLLVATITVCPPGGNPAAVAGEKIQAIIRGKLGRSGVGAQGFRFSEWPVEKLSPAEIFLPADTPPTAAGWQRLVPPDLATNFGRLTVSATAASNVFAVKIANGSIASAADYLKWSDQYAPAFDEVRAALQRPYAIIPGDYTEAPRMPIPNFVMLRSLAQTLAQRCQCYLLLGQPDKAVRELELIHDVCRILQKPPTGQPETLVEAMINVAIHGLYVATVQDGLQRHAWQGPQIETIQRQLREVDLAPWVSAAMHMEQVHLAFIGQRYSFRQIMDPGATFGWGSRHKPWWEKLLSHKYDLIPRGWMYQNTKYAVALEQTLLDAFDPANKLVNPRKFEEANDCLIASFDHWHPFQYLAAIAIPNFTKAMQTCAFNQTLANQAQIACALERFKLVHGAYPETLDALAPQFIEKIPVDIIGGQPLPYRRTDDGKFLLYSVGWNETDDGGTPGTLAEVKKGDWVWKN